ncbi:hypothetical protein [Granulicatella elegans]|uniref:hypothetical protein n=1 Tax=Granulicatella elegans TaxID=137732 RepID=UPI001D13ABD2|nr:hypothetical protein [Granulicatella elegans]UEA30907.1 hypothetical protein LK443_06405 [Granulicatella elegans]
MKNKVRFKEKLFLGTTLSFEFDGSTIGKDATLNQWVNGKCSIENAFVSLKVNGEFLRVREVDQWIESLRKMKENEITESWHLSFEEEDIALYFSPREYESDVCLLGIRLRPFIKGGRYLTEYYEISLFEEEIFKLLDFLEYCREYSVSPLEKVAPSEQDGEYKYCCVSFEGNRKQYVYLCHKNLEVEVGDYVTVPVGEYFQEVEAFVEKVFYGDEEATDFPIEELKYITNVVSSHQEAVNEYQLSIPRDQIIYNSRENELREKTIFGRKNKTVNPVHILKTTIGEFWLEADGEVIPMHYEFTQLRVWQENLVNGSYRLRPAQLEELVGKTVGLKASMDFEEMRYITSYEGMDLLGAQWQWNQLAVGMWAEKVDPEHYEIEVDSNGVVYYPSTAEKASFGVAWTTYVDDEDATIWMNIE